MSQPTFSNRHFLLKLRKKWVLFPLGLLFILILHYPLQWIRLPFVSVSAFEAVPKQSVAIIAYDQATMDGDSWASQLPTSLVAKDQLLQKWTRLNKQIDALFQSDSSLVQALRQNSRLYTALQTVGSTELDFSLIFDAFPSALDLEEWIEQQGWKSRRSAYRGQTLHEIQWKDGRRLYVAPFRNLLIAAPYAFLVEDAIGQLKKRPSNLLSSIPHRWMANRPIPPQHLRLWVNWQYADQWLTPLLRNQQRPLATSISQTGTWQQMDIGINGALLQAKGWFQMAEEQKLLSLIAQQQPKKELELAKTIPNHTAAMIWLTSDQMPQFYEAFQTANTEYIQKYILPWMSDELAYVLTEPYSSSLKDEQLAFFRSSSPDLAAHYLEKLADQLGALKSFEYQTYAIKQLKLDDLLLPLLGPSLNLIHHPYYTQIEDVVVFSNSRQALEICLDKYLSGQTLDRAVHFLRSMQDLQAGEGAQALLYAYPKYGLQLAKTFLRPASQASISQAFQPYRLFKPIIAPLSTNGK
ncbi:MAG: hypothetical protein AAFP19_26655, partial [Bacteroidota bacterium]